MTKLRLATYTGLSMWLGAAAYAWYIHLREGVTVAAVVNTVIVAALVATLAVMGRRDTRRGIVHDQREELGEATAVGAAPFLRFDVAAATGVDAETVRRVLTHVFRDSR